MTIDELVSPDNVAVGVRASGKAALMEELARRAGHAFGLDTAVVRVALQTRETLGSTGVGDGIALPHTRLDTIQRPSGLFLRLRDAVDYDAIDERPVDLVFLLLLPSTQQGTQLNALACVSRRLRDPEVAAALRGARDAAALHAIMRGGEPVR